MQRVAIARALVFEPLILLADEPTGNLDSRNGEEILALLRQTSRDSGLTILMVTHDPKAATYGDRTVIIRDGRVDEARSA
jgi:putative ABC transport system ATP-binding protein